MSDGSIFYNKSKHSNSETENENSTELEIKVNYKLSIKKADSTSLSTKNYSVIISELDEFLLSIQNNITVLLKDEKIDANNYNVSFKSEKTQGAGTLLVDIRDFENFKSEYTKLVAAKEVMLISITMNKKEKQVDEITSDDDIDHDDDSIPNIYNKNKVPKISDIFLFNQRIGKNITELRRETWCSMHNMHCLKDCKSYVEIITYQSLPSMIKFLQQLDEAEEIGDYYVKFLEGFEKQQVRVKYLYKLNDTQFEACGVTTIGDIETIRDAAKKYK
ncbi:hypothetical protein GLOIN_2v1844088 [Rhizophagus clarus]|uniref:Uncharacterized protein n=1 Tax=Rhizophagus clarus TaxID=94130 RepID=A0A8H3QM30_9GLOM|nr:hypothetical protein GLOIN_2v1844088 [Rhizophagus clarus]